MELSGRIAVVTGAAGGIGRALAVGLARRGMDVVVTDIAADPLAATRQLVEQNDRECLNLVVDVTDPTAVERLAQAVYSRFGAADVICSNAGIMEPGAVWEQDARTWSKVLDVNLFGTVNIAREFIPRMLASGRDGHFLTTPGLIGLFTIPFSPPGSYAVSKHALLAFTETLHQELTYIGAPIGVSALCPSGVRTSLSFDPATLQGETVRRPEVWSLMQELADSIETGTEPAEVADIAIEAVIAGRFWIYPHPDRLSRARNRAEYALAGEQPTAPPPPRRVE